MLRATAGAILSNPRTHYYGESPAVRETAEIQRLYKAGIDGAQRMVMATVVEVAGSSYRRPGAHLLVLADGSKAGSISAGCLEADIAAKHDELFALGRCQLLRYENKSDDIFGLNLGCDGTISVLIEPIEVQRSCASRISYPETARLANVLGKQLIIATIFESNDEELLGMRVLYGDDVRDGCGIARIVDIDDRIPKSLERAICSTFKEVERGGGHQHRVFEEPRTKVFFELVKPQAQLFIFGAGDDVRSLIEMADVIGFSTTVIDKRQSFLDKYEDKARTFNFRDVHLRKLIESPEMTAIVIMSHNYEFDKEFLLTALETDCSYLGIMGPARRTMQMLVELGKADVVAQPNKATPAESELSDVGAHCVRPRERILHYPIGMDLNAETPEEIALAICSELVAHFRGGDGQSLSKMSGPIHRRIESEELLQITTGGANA